MSSIDRVPVEATKSRVYIICITNTGRKLLFFANSSSVIKIIKKQFELDTKSL